MSDISILNGASDLDLKQSLNISSGATNNHYSDDNDDQENTNTNAQTAKNSTSKIEFVDNRPLSLNFISSQQPVNENTEIETINFDNKRSTEAMDLNKNENTNNMPKKKKFKKTVKTSSNNSSNININKIIEQMNQIKEADLEATNSNFNGIDHIKNENVTDFELIPLSCEKKATIKNNLIVFDSVNCNTISEPKHDVAFSKAKVNPTPTIVKLTNELPTLKLNQQHIEDEISEKKNGCIGNFFFIYNIIEF